MLLIGKIIGIFVGESSLTSVVKSFFVFPSSHWHLYFVVEVLLVLSKLKARTQRSITRSKLTSFLSVEVVTCDV